MAYKTKFGSLNAYEKGTIDVKDDKSKYLFSNVFEVAGKSKPFERVAVVKNLEYTAEVTKVDGDGPWYIAPHDEFAIVMDGEVEFNFVKVDEGAVPSGEGATQLSGAPNGQRMGKVIARRGHQVLLPGGAAYQLTSKSPSVVIYQTLAGPVTVERWKENVAL
jgi:hypothetical protein